MAVVHGLIGGLVGASCMTVLRMIAHRRGLIDKTPPQVIEEWASHKTGIEPPGGEPGHQLASEALHLAYGAVWGSVYGAVCPRNDRWALPAGAALGAGVWALGFFAIMPALSVTRPAWRATAAENAVNVAAHVVYGLAAAFVAQELQRQPERRPTSDTTRMMTSVG